LDFVEHPDAQENSLEPTQGGDIYIAAGSVCSISKFKVYLSAFCSFFTCGKSKSGKSKKLTHPVKYLYCYLVPQKKLVTMVIYVRIYKVSLEHIQSIDVRNGIWEEPSTIFGKEMSPSSDAFEWDYLYWMACSCTLRFNCPHTSLRIMLILSRNKPTDECTRNDVTIVSINKREQKAKSCN